MKSGLFIITLIYLALPLAYAQNDNKISKTKVKTEVNTEVKTDIKENINTDIKEDVKARDLVDKAYNQTLGKTNKSTVTMTITRPQWSRTVTMTSWSLGTDYFLIYISQPAREHGQTFLKRKKNMWNWIPSIGRSIKIPPSMMLSSWMGSDFNNNELVKQNSLVNDYTHKMLADKVVANAPCYQIELTPLPTAPVVWGKVILYINKQYGCVINALYYDEKGILTKQLTGSDITDYGDRHLPATLEMIPVLKKGYKTVMHTDQSAFNVKGITMRMFTEQQMKRIHL